MVNITGSVSAPGTYTISGFSSVINALYAAGGPTENGSYRDIKVLRNGKAVTTIDLYDYFVKGTYPSFFLNDQDVMVVAPHHNRIIVQGAFKTEGRFETLKNEKVEDLLSYTGGFASTAYKQAIYVDRVSDLQRKIIKVSKNNYGLSLLQDGDIVEAKNISNNYLNKVSVSGEVYLPGNYPLDESPNLSALLESTSGLTANAYTDAAILYRSQQGFVNEVKTIDLDDVVLKNKDVKLQPNDSLVVISSKNINPQKTVSIQGMVNTPDVYEFYQGMTARDLVLIANGFKDKANTKKIELFSNSSAENKNETVNSRSFSFEKSSNEKLLPSDLLVIRRIPGYRPTDFVSLEGRALNPGAYPLRKKEYRIYDLFMDSGGSVGRSDNLAILVERTVLEETKEKIEGLQGDMVDFKNLFNNKTERGKFGEEYLEDIVKDFDCILHLAAYANPRHALEEPQPYIDTNITGTQRIIEVAEAHDIPVVYASSSCVMHGQPLPWNEKDLPLHQNNAYGWSKRVNECQFINSQILKTIGLRFFSAYGPYGRPDTAIFLFADAISNGTEMTLYNKGHMKRDFTFIDDIIHGIIKLIDKIPDNQKSSISASSPPYKIYNIGNNSPVTLNEFITAIENACGKKAIKNLLPMQPGDVPTTFADIDDLIKDVGFKPSTTIREGIEKFVGWYLYTQQK